MLLIGDKIDSCKTNYNDRSFKRDMRSINT